MEREFLGNQKAKLWTYLIIGVVLIAGILVVNFAVVNPDAAQEGLDSMLGLPSWAFVAIGLVVGSLVYWLGLKIETDWPELLGALMIGGSVFAAEMMIGLEVFQFGGIVVIPYVIPLAIFVVLMIVAMARSR